MRWAVTFEDPTTWTQPWTAVMLVQQSDDAIFEYACHEGNYAMEGDPCWGTRRADRTVVSARRPVEPIVSKVGVGGGQIA